MSNREPAVEMHHHQTQHHADMRPADMQALFRILQRIETATHQTDEAVKKLEEANQHANHQRELKSLQDQQAAADIHKALKDLADGVNELRAAFPDDDPRGHRAYHDQKLLEAAQRKKRRDEVLTEIWKKGTWALLALLGLAVWELVKTQARAG